MTASIVGPDPLVTFLRAHTADKHPIPLVATRIDVTIRGALARVTTERTFRNDEKQSIEATMTFPVPVDATLCSLSARIDGRTLTAVAQARQEARETYESAVDQGKAAVLHEELLKGIHMLSVAHVQPGATIVVTDTWTAPLAFVGGTPQLRIPTTVGDLYGRSPLAPSDDLVTADVVHEATIRVACENGVATIARSGAASDGSHTIRLDAPIDITVSGFVPRALEGIAADGRRVTLHIEPAPVADASLDTDSLDIDLLFDRSGSMNERASSDHERGATKYTVAKAGLVTAIGARFKGADRMRLWEFNDAVHCVGEESGTACKRLVEALRGPDGGTEVGLAIEAAIATEKTGNIVVVTDGKSWALDPQRLARTGIRVTAVLIGEDALDAGISHLAGMTGGQSFVAASSDAGIAITAAIEAARAPRTMPQPIEGKPMQVVALRRGARVIAAWGEPSEQVATAETRQIGATAAMLAIPLMQESEAKALAEAEGVVCHLTSLVLVDEAGVRHEGLPAVRKVALAAPAMARAMAMPVGMLARHDAPSAAPAASRSTGRAGILRRYLTGGAGAGLRGMIAHIDWDDDPDALCRGDLASLPQDVVAAIEHAARLPAVVALASSLGHAAAVVVIALMAKAAGSASRSAQRIARTLLAAADQSAVAAAMAAAGL